MEADWIETARVTVPSPSPSARLTTFAFDPSQELLWAGNEHGKITSFYAPELRKYTSYRGHVSNTPRGAPGNAPVKQFLFCDKGIISVSPRSVHLSSRRGLAQWHVCQIAMIDLQCMSFTSREANEVIVAGCQAHMFRIDVEKGTVLETITQQSPVRYTLMRLAGQHICAASLDGSIHLLDPKTLSVVNSWKAYAGSVNDMDARGDYLLTCGWAQVQHQGMGLERLVRVYDLKAQRPAPPVPFQQGAASVRLHPKLSSTCIVVSQSGLVHSIDIQNPDMPRMKYAQPDLQYTSLELMPSGKGLALADSNGQITIWATPSKVQFTEFGKAPDFADATAKTQKLSWSGESPLNQVGIPYYREALFSGWPNSLLHQVGTPPARIDPLDNTFRPFDYGRVGPNPRKGRRYEASPVKAFTKSADPLAAPKFLSEKPREDDGDRDQSRRMSEDFAKALARVQLDGTAASDAKFLYRIVEIKYSKFGVEDFDFRYYNKTKYAGLETHIVNSYANPLLQLLRFTMVARNLALNHTAQDCKLDNCLLCELGFLADMLEKAKAPNCQATNFLKALSREPDAAAQNILEESMAGSSLTAMLQNLHRFLLQKFERNFLSVAPSLDQFHLAFGTIGLDHMQCQHCGYESRVDKVWYTHDLQYPQVQAKFRNARRYFSQVLKSSIERSHQHRGWCLRCNGYKAMLSHRAIHCLPATLMLNACASTPEARHTWSTPGFLPKEIGVIVNNGRFYPYEGQDLQVHLQRGHYNMTVYQLVGVVADVKTGDQEKSHLVASIDTALAEPDRSQQGNWHLFNDFLVQKISPEDAVYFNPQWKLPCVITYQVKSSSHIVDDSWKERIDTSILYRSPQQPALTPDYKFTPLSEKEPLPGSTSHVGIDAEFVRLLREEIDVGADGSRMMTRPARSGLARVSVLRGDGLDQELPFIDDYISIDEPIDDYLTKYSGLQPGDLTEGSSRFKLVGLKEVYKKLWVLLNLGCTFIGHGLSSDFRIINIHVPDSQAIDTQELFSLRERARRKLSLRFLAWVVLKEEVQKNAAMGHDSIEDARTAIKLWRKYLEYSNAGIFETIMDEVWSKGRQTEFKVPSDIKRLPETPTASAPGTPLRRPVRMATPQRSDYGSPTK
ncbi:PAN2-PAN3 deadenylation complex catalytic subunit PAN2 [Fulvia fulva]|uniref:PAN2-PAN3 deadenylation complex catalytic subunit PAN2 n=1 Tax=Passalora fulva TaxID=5499 RepID=A0A9Q8L7C6_PASFU|nr:PAN2-PAN3 deadenylation complex catalytic subunit PAN2 [Fulvia fulva]KAK4636083.1 PAN2-PAN3 deadenylation complex catalytic subunit PAN2 [Fulvia fulva]KAK4637652.1 PAN2-PAN3 deadenylation complex catalytic subunit PAN2 [Fulvia fulva]UJO11543.1 PAN2-PAN3 deadenylation complex catalytic subunit PAN2 [Fulvia fulva]WPV09989.1 PAN2-PAN3 deadenylation complex catalytic subunit PAN2 [Fulvia fulva]WPV23063.1 PAN2-PAN3 deadenylation complex catalytic subunit PAN2 [Fulvia fulva]